MAIHSSTLAWRIPWTEEPGGLLYMGLHRVGHDWSDLTWMHALEKEMATHSSILAWRIPGMGESGGLLSLGSHRVGHDWSVLAAAAATFLMICPCLCTWNNEGQCKIPHAATETSCSQNKPINTRKGEPLYGKLIFSNAMSLHRFLCSPQWTQLNIHTIIRHSWLGNLWCPMQCLWRPNSPWRQFLHPQLRLKDEAGGRAPTRALHGPGSALWGLCSSKWPTLPGAHTFTVIRHSFLSPNTGASLWKTQQRHKNSLFKSNPRTSLVVQSMRLCSQSSRPGFDPWSGN